MPQEVEAVVPVYTGITLMRVVTVGRMIAVVLAVSVVLERLPPGLLVVAVVVMAVVVEKRGWMVLKTAQ